MVTSSTPTNRTLFQTFEWHTPSSPQRSHYKRLAHLLPKLVDVGVTGFWLGPGCKANNPNGNGYDIYDLWDLGEFDQKGTRGTKWGNREELDELLKIANEYDVDCTWDAVLNHKTSGDCTQQDVWAVEVDKEDRRYEICPPKKIEAWLEYEFPGREREGMKYSKMKWRSEHFNGVDWDQSRERHAIYKIIDDPSTHAPFKQPQRPASRTSSSPLALLRQGLGLLSTKQSPASPTSQPSPAPAIRPGKGWATDVDGEHGNNDYLMFANIDYEHPEVREDVLNWGRWMVNDVGVQGFRLDAVQHFSFNFTKDWIQHVAQAGRTRNGGRDVFVVGEIWSGETNRITKWLDAVQQPCGPQIYAYDSPLLYNFSRISEDFRTGSQNMDLRTIMRGSLLQLRPQAAVTLVTNHDTQPGQTSYTPMLAELKLLFYAFILLWKEGYPCVFWGDLVGTKGPEAEGPACVVRGKGKGNGGQRSLLPDLMLCRKLFAYGEQISYAESMTCLGFTRAGVNDRPGSGCAVIMSMDSANAQLATKVTSAAERKENREATHPAFDQKRTTERIRMQIGRPGEIWIDVLDMVEEEVTIDSQGFGDFCCQKVGVSVFVRKGAEGVNRFPVDFDLDVYGHEQ